MSHIRSPRWWTELSLILVIYAAYSGARLLARGDEGVATENGLAILELERALALNAVEPLNRLFTEYAALGVPASFLYASLHYLVTPAILIWLFRRQPIRYRLMRTWLAASTLLGLIGFTLLPTAPPRLLGESSGFTDTLEQYTDWGWWSDAASAPSGLGDLTNQYAAMPSLHVGWAFWCGVVLWLCARRTLAVRTIAIGYPLMTCVVVMGTANHFLLDLVGGVVVMVAGLLLARPLMRLADGLLSRFRVGLARQRGSEAPPPEPASDGAGVPCASGGPVGSVGSVPLPLPCQDAKQERAAREEEPEPASAGGQSGSPEV